MSNVLSLRLARERAWQSVWNSETTELDGGSASNPRLLERLEAENAQLRRSVVELALQIQALRDDARALTA
jgi:cell division protein FtsB